MTTIAELEDRRQEMLLQKFEHDRHIHSIDLIIDSVLLSSMLRSATDLLDVIKGAVRIAVPDKAVATRYLHLLGQKHQVPAATTLRRHRFTLLTGFCRWQASKLTAFLKESGGEFVRWATADASPQGGYDWLNQGEFIVSVIDFLVHHVVWAFSASEHTNLASLLQAF